MKKQIEKKTNKKTCQFCGNNQYNEVYNQHLRTQHKRELGTRAMVKKLDSEQLEKVRQLITNLTK